jgi:hypothetical protein
MRVGFLPAEAHGITGPSKRVFEEAQWACRATLIDSAAIRGQGSSSYIDPSGHPQKATVPGPDVPNWGRSVLPTNVQPSN